MGVRYDARERLQVAQLEPGGVAAVHLQVGDVIREVNDTPIASKCMLQLLVDQAAAAGQPVKLAVERLMNDDALGDLVETPPDVVEIARRQVSGTSTFFT